MTQRDVLSAKQTVENFLRANGVTSIYSTSTSGSWGLYVNWTNKVISLHGPSSSDWRNAVNTSGTVANTFAVTSNGMWIGPFSTFDMAYTFSELLRRALYLSVHEETVLTSSRGISPQPIKLF